MKRSYKAMSGVTLLEVLLVLAIASLILLMAGRYYRNASASKQANDVMSTVQAILAYADNVAGASGSYSNITSGGMQASLPAGGKVPWNTSLYSIAPSPNSYVVTIPGMPGDVCPLVSAKLTGLAGFTPAACGASGADYTYTYSNSSF